MWKNTTIGACTLVLLGFLAAQAEARRPIRIARVLDTEKGYDEFTFRSNGNEILIAEVASSVYQTRGRQGGEHEEPMEVLPEDGLNQIGLLSPGTAEGESGGCEGSGNEGGGCSSGGEDEAGCGGGAAGELCLQLLDPDGNVLCWAGRPVRPGWMRDPQLACSIPEGYLGREFVLRVRQGKCGSTVLPEINYDAMPGDIVYTLTVTLLPRAREGRLNGVQRGR